MRAPISRVSKKSDGFIWATEAEQKSSFFELTKTCLLHKETYWIIFSHWIITVNLLDNVLSLDNYWKLTR